MAVVQRIVVALDGGPSGDAALDWVIDRSRSHNLSLDVIVVQEPMSYDDGSGFTTPIDFHSVYEALLDAAGERLRAEAPELPFRPILRMGRPRIELAEAARDSDLLVAGSNRRGHLAGAFSSTLALRLAATAACPTVVVPEGWRRTTDDGHAAEGIVVGVNITKDQPAVMAFAAEEARHDGSAVTLVAAWNVPTLVAVSLLAQPQVWKSMELSREAEFARTVEDVTGEFPDHSITPVLREGPAGRILADAASRAQLLVIGRRRRGRSPVDNLLLGSTAHSVLLDLPCPVAVVPA